MTRHNFTLRLKVGGKPWTIELQQMPHPRLPRKAKKLIKRVFAEKIQLWLQLKESTPCADPTS